MSYRQPLNTEFRFVFIVVYLALAVCILADDLSRATAAEVKDKLAVISNHQRNEKARETGSRGPAATQCCACGKAHYKVTFIATWKRTSHPKHFPGPMARWSPMMGCSHNNKYVLWRYGSMASRALRRFSELGDTRLLQDQMTRQLNKNVLNIIKTSAIWSGNGKSSARFAVDHKHNLVSVVARVTPSPDWNVGIDSVNLCTVNCTWVKFHAVDLHVWDGGTDDGITFISVNKRTNPQQSIQRISNKLHWHPKSSLYKKKGEARKPFGQLRIELHHISGNCGARRRPPSPPRAPRRDCVVTKWSSWTRCTCFRGKAAHVRGRVVIKKPSKDGLQCPLLRETKKCRCLPLNNKNTTSRDCKVGSWSSWSPCTTKCKGGRRIKTRAIIQQPDICGRRCPKLIRINKNCGSLDKCNSDETVIKDCVVSDWSRWSPCSKACNRGKRVRTRIVKEAQQNGGKKCPNLVEKQKCEVHNFGIKR